MASKESNGKQAAMSASSFKDHGGSADIPELTTESITDAVLGQMAQTPDPRLKEVMDAAVRHLHNFAREVNLTPAEWLLAIEFLTKVGQKCTPGPPGVHIAFGHDGVECAGAFHARQNGHGRCHPLESAWSVFS